MILISFVATSHPIKNKCIIVYLYLMIKLFIVGFSKNLGEIELVEMFSLYGAVNTVTIITDKNTGESKCYGFVMMADLHGAERAIIALNGAFIGDRQITVRVADNKGNDGSPANPAPSSLRKKRPRRSF